MTLKEKTHYEELFKSECFDRASEIDPNEELHWWDSLVIGWAIGKGLSPKEALEFASYLHTVNFKVG